MENHDILIEILQKRFLEKTADEWLKLLEEADVPCAPVNSIDRALSDPQTLARNMVIDIKHPKLPTFQLAGNPIKSSEMEDFFAPPPQLGENTREVLKGVLGYSEAKVDQLTEEKAIGILKQEKEDKEDDE